ncbi:hypothetical protein CISIN_1g036108mg [Citrus sinensis]|uniref:Uncharacterized protein n=1 Tax=Citrus sinensis TaxID=2711 RepID=A0A067CZY7_CITSI|nr:hypothetical protein CISIN_1g036108mg [Citrus sinensis]
MSIPTAARLLVVFQPVSNFTHTYQQQQVPKIIKNNPEFTHTKKKKKNCSNNSSTNSSTNNTSSKKHSNSNNSSTNNASSKKNSSSNNLVKGSRVALCEWMRRERS